LSPDEYREAYRSGPFRELMRTLWNREHLVAVGFSIEDVWLSMVADEVLERPSEGASEPRHIAIVGVPEPAADQALR